MRVSLPCGFSEAGFPYSFQFMGSRLSEPLLCRIGHAYEEATAWHTLHPEV
jgi:amidase